MIESLSYISLSNYPQNKINITNYNNFMNLAIFLHSNKEDKETSLSLPLAPVYCFPQHRWYFSSPSFVPLRKRRQNSSFHKYLQSFQSLGQQKKDNNTTRQNIEKSLLCLYEKRDYLSGKIRHVFDSIWMTCRSEMPLRDKVVCGCSEQPEQEGVKVFKMNTNELNNFFELSKKSVSEDSTKNIQNMTNWNEFTRLIIKEKAKINVSKESQLYFYRLPVNVSQEREPLIFSLLWNDNFIVFNNGNDLAVNQHMKTKAVELSDLVRRKLQRDIMIKFQREMERVVEQIRDHKNFIERGKNILKINSFRLWFYKKQENNEIYIIGISQLTFKGVECILYKNVNFKCGLEKVDYNEQLGDLKFNEELIDRDFRFMNNKMRELSLNNKISIPSRTLISSNSNRVRLLSNLNKQNNREQKEQQNRVKENENGVIELSQTQCSCCKNLLLANEIANQITAKHIKQIRYLRQVKMGKQQFDDYQFVKICSLCYEVYLKHYKHMNNVKNKNKEKKTISFYQYKQKEGLSSKGQHSLSIAVKENKDIENDNKINNIVFKGLKKGVSEKLRAKSQLNSSKEQFQVLEKLQVKKYYNGLIKKGNPLIASVKNKKTKTNHTTNSQTIDNQLAKIKTIREQIQMQRTFTQNDKTSLDPNQSKSLPKSQSFKWKGSMMSKNMNIISKMNIKSDLNDRQTQSKSNGNNQFKLQKHSEAGHISKNTHGQILINAIQQYQNISRPSFKRLVYKNHKNCIRRQVNLNLEDSVDDLRSIHWKKKSIHSYNEQ